MIFSIDDESFKNRIALIDGPTGEQWTYQRLCDEVRLRQKALQTVERKPWFFISAEILQRP